MNPTTQIVEQAIAKQEAEDNGIIADDTKQTPPKDDSASKPKSGADDSKKSDDKDADKPKYDENGKRIEAPKEEKPELDADGKPVEEPKKGEFTADDALEVETPKDNTPQAPTDNAGIILSPAEQKYIADNIGEPIVIQGFRGEGENQQAVEIKAYSPSDIPKDFKFANDQQLAAATSSFQSLEKRAGDLLGQYRNNQSNEAAADFERRENEGIRGDLSELQKEGRFPKFTVQPGADGFEDTAEAQQMAEVLKIMTDTNERYLREYNQGRPYKHIGFAEAFSAWESKNPAKQAERKTNDDQKKEDEERLKKAERGPSNSGMNPSNIVKPTVRSGTTTRDILARIDAEF
jgi:hypothetical protein